jgi:hypothetical protein
MMNLFSRNAIVGFSSLFFIVIYAVCSDGGDWYNNYGSNFAPETFVDKSYEPLFLSGEMFYGDESYDDNHVNRFSDAIVKDWKGYLGNSMAEKEIRYFAIKDSSATDFWKICKDIQAKKKTSVWKNKFDIADVKVINFFNFLKAASKVDEFSMTRMSWDYDSNQSASLPKLPVAEVKYIENTYNNFKDPFLKNRYWFLAMKANFYSVDKNNTILFFNKTQANVPKNTLFYRGMAYVAGVLYKSKDYARSNFLYSVVFDNCAELRKTTTYSFHPQDQKDFNLSLEMAKTNEQKASLWALYGYYADASEAVGKMYELNPKSEHLEFMLTRLINSEEASLNNLPFKNIPEYKKMIKDSLNKKSYNLITKIAQNKSTLKPYLWETAAGYYEIFNGDYAKANLYFNQAEKTMTKTDLSKNQLRLFRLINNIASTDKMNAKSEKLLLEELVWLYALGKKEDYSSKFRYSNAIGWSQNYISKLYNAQKDIVMEEMFVRNPDFYLNPTNLESMKAFFAKSNKSPWENMAASIYSVSEDDIYDYQAVTFTFKNDIDNAVIHMEKAPTANAVVLYGNPFNGNIKDCHDCDHVAYQKRKFTMLEFLKTVQEMQQNIKKGVDVYTNSLLVANAFYNISYFGNARLFYEGNIMGEYGNGISYEYNGISNKYYDMLCGNKYAKIYYEKALAAAQNKEQKAKCIYMLTKLERNIFYETKDFDYSDKAFKAFEGFKKLKKDYADTKYYQDVINECGYFRTYAGM